MDGYQVAAIMFVFDERITDPEEIGELVCVLMCVHIIHTHSVSFTYAHTASLRTLQREIYDHAYRWLNALPLYPRVGANNNNNNTNQLWSLVFQLRIMQTACSPLPSIDPVPECCPNGPTWVWWFVHALPTTPQKKLDFLKCVSLRERLLMLKEVLPVPV